MRRRDIFSFVSEEKRKVAKKESKLFATEIAAVLKRYKLVGISWSDDPDAMIEDTKVKKTFFVKIGNIMDKVKVQAILKDKVVLEYRGEKIELK